MLTISGLCYGQVSYPAFALCCNFIVSVMDCLEEKKQTNSLILLKHFLLFKM